MKPTRIPGWRDSWKIQVGCAPFWIVLRHTVTVIVIKQLFCSQVSQGDGRDNSGNRKTSHHPKWWHTDNPNFKLAGICF